MGKAGKQEKGAEEKPLRPQQLGGHRLERFRGEWRCAVCYKAPRVWNTLAGGVCKGSAAGKWAGRAWGLGWRGGRMVLAT